MKAFATAFGLSFIAEFGDKTQIAILTLSARFGWFPVFLGAVVAFAVLNAIAVTLGVLIAGIIPVTVIRYISAAVFVVFGVLSFRPENEAQEEEALEKKSARRGPFVTSILALSLLELGDKTQLSLIALASKYKAPFFVFLGGTLALTLTSLIGALVGKGLSLLLPLKWLRWFSGIVFIAFGALIAAGAM